MCELYMHIFPNPFTYLLMNNYHISLDGWMFELKLYEIINILFSKHSFQYCTCMATVLAT